jgi:hypothetical protein
MKKVLTKGDLIVTLRSNHESGEHALIIIKDTKNNVRLNIYPHEAEFLRSALQELLQISTNPPPDQL